MDFRFMATVIFWVCAVPAFLSFVAYPFLVMILSRLFKAVPPPETDEELPPVSVIITAFNEEDHIRKRLENILSLDYPNDRLQTIVHTDGSTDRTDSIIGEYEDRGIIHLTSPVNRGKTVALNDAVMAASAPLLIFSDANSEFRPDAAIRLARWFLNESIGCVCGRLIYRRPGFGEAQTGENKYWNWDARLKTAEGSSGHLLGGNGAIFAITRSMMIPLPGSQSNDMILPIVTRLRGKLVIYDPEAVAYEPPAGSVTAEFYRKKRIIARGLRGVFFSLHFAFTDLQARKTCLLKRAYAIFQMVMKKLFRYLAFPGIVVMMISGLFSHNSFTVYTDLVLCAALAAASGWSLFAGAEKPRRKDFSYPLFMALAGCAGFLDFITGKDVSRWKSRR